MRDAMRLAHTLGLKPEALSESERILAPKKALQLLTAQLGDRFQSPVLLSAGWRHRSKC